MVFFSTGCVKRRSTRTDDRLVVLVADDGALQDAFRHDFN
jgi:hypothetical protein